MSAHRDYWKECLSEAADECGLKLTAEQLDCLAGAAESGHEHYGMAFYSPPASDRVAAVERECREKLKAQQTGHERYVRNAETGIKQALRVRSDALVTIGEDGEVLLDDGRTVRIQ